MVQLNPDKKASSTGVTVPPKTSLWLISLPRTYVYVESDHT